MFSKIRFCLLFGWCMFGHIQPGEAQEAITWSKEHNDKGVIWQEGKQPNEKLLSFKIKTTLDTDVPHILGIFADFSHSTEWMYGATTFAILKQSEDKSLVTFYSRFATPWPCNDRDVIMHMTTSFEAERVLIQFNAVPAYNIPLPQKVTRMPDLRGHWILTPRGPNQTEVEYSVHANPGGSIPYWLVNLTAKKMPLSTVQALKAQITKPGRGDSATTLRVTNSPQYQSIIQKFSLPTS